MSKPLSSLHIPHNPQRAVEQRHQPTPHNSDITKTHHNRTGLCHSALPALVLVELRWSKRKKKSEWAWGRREREENERNKAVRASGGRDEVIVWQNELFCFTCCLSGRAEGRDAEGKGPCGKVFGGGRLVLTFAGSGSGLWDIRTALVLLKHTNRDRNGKWKGWRDLKSQLKPSYTWIKLLYFICMSYYTCSFGLKLIYIICLFLKNIQCDTTWLFKII